MSKRTLTLSLVAAIALSILSFAEDHSKVHQPKLTPQNSGTTQGLIAVSPVNSRVVWASGRGGTFVRTTNGGKTWKAGVVPGAEALQFRDVQAVSAKIAYLLSIGDNPTDFRIYKTVDAGKTWTMQFQNHIPTAFYDCFGFWTPRRGIVHSDSVEGIFPDRRTRNGKTWRDISNNMAPALPGEASFSSSGTCVATQGGRNAWIATGGSTTARILATRDGGDTWNAYDTPLVSSPSAGAFTVAFRDPWHGIVGGGDLDPAHPNDAATAISDDGGRTWTLTKKPPVTGAIFGLGYVRGVESLGKHHDDGENRDEDEGGRAVVITANTGGAAWSPNEGKTWFALPGVNGFWAVAFANPEAGWLVGLDGTIMKISF